MSGIRLADQAGDIHFVAVETTREIKGLVSDDMPDGCPKHGIDIGILIQANVVCQNVAGIAPGAVIGLLRKQSQLFSGCDLIRIIGSAVAASVGFGNRAVPAFVLCHYLSRQQQERKQSIKCNVFHRIVFLIVIHWFSFPQNYNKKPQKIQPQNQCPYFFEVENL